MTTCDTHVDLASLKTFADLKSALLQAFDRYAALARPDAAACGELRDKLAAGRFNVVALGQFKRGKSCLINALLGDSLLPIASVPLTSVAVTVSHGAAEAVTVYFSDGSPLAIDRADLAAYATEAGNPRNCKAVQDIRVALPAALLADGVSLLDTPGVGSVHRHNTDTAYAVLPRCDAALFLLSADQPLAEAELAYLHAVQAHARRIFFVLNKIDYLDAAELEASLAFVRQRLHAAIGTDIKLFPVSAKQALQGKIQQDAALLERSRLPALTAHLEAFLLHEKGKILLLGSAARFARQLTQASLEMQLEQQAARADPAELDVKIAQFRSKRASLAADKRRLRQQIQLDIRHLIQHGLDPAVQQCRTRLMRQLPAQFDSFAHAHSELALRALDEALEGFIEDALRSAFAVWQAEQAPRLAAELASLSQRCSSEAAHLAATLQQFSADLLHVPYTPVAAADLSVVPDEPSLDLAAEPLGLDMLAESAVLDWPARISPRLPRLKAVALRWANRRIIARRRADLLAAIDRQSGQARYATLARLEAAGSQFAQQLSDSVDRTAEGIASALTQGREERLMAAGQAQQRQQTLAVQLAETQQLQIYVESIRVAAEHV